MDSENTYTRPVITVVKLEVQGGGQVHLLRRGLGVPEQLSLRDMGFEFL